MDFVITNQPQAITAQKRQRYQMMKRLLDIVLCIIALPLTLPVVAFCAILIRLDSPGPALFIQERIGKDGKRFKIYKFRTMHHNLDDSGHRAFMKAYVSGKIEENGNANVTTVDTVTHNVENTRTANSLPGLFTNFLGRSQNKSKRMFKPFDSSQVTRVGRILRKTSLDELPQILNVLRGDMSFIGPRPNVPWEVEAYKSWHWKRLEVLPGITGLAQVRGRSSICFDEIVTNDVEYIEKMSLSQDLKVLWWTVTSVMTGKGAS